MDFVLRNLEFEDIFTMTTILSKIGTDELKDCFSSIDIAKLAKGKNDNVLEKVGMQVVFNMVGVLLKNLPNCKNELYSFLASMANLTVDEVKALSPANAFELIMLIVKGEDFKDFLRVALKSLGSEN